MDIRDQLQSTLNWDGSCLAQLFHLTIQSQPFTSLITHTLHVYSGGTQVFNDHLKSFWELESFGISPSSSSDSLEFENSIRFVDGRYQVELRWKESHPPLADHYDLCLKRLHGLVRRLQQDPVMLQEYDMTIKGQLKRNEGLLSLSRRLPTTSLHYLPHHAVVRHDKKFVLSMTHRHEPVHMGLHSTIASILAPSLVPSPSFSRIGRRARFAWGRKKKGLVHTVCACVKKSWNSETSWHGQDIFGYFGHN